MENVMVGMSGGVDSSVAAMLLSQAGYRVTGVTLKLFSDDDLHPEQSSSSRTCCSLTDIEDARSVAYRLGFDHLVFNFKEAFRKNVMLEFVQSYLHGTTPNPCISCNRYIKFDKMLRRAEALGYDYIATGHYAISVFDTASGRYQLRRPADRSKDQTYVLYTLTQHQLAHTLFPLGELSKTEVRALADAAGLVNSHKPDSQDICFVPDGDYARFIRAETDAVIPNGDFVDMQGHRLGRHRGMIHYTIGQRRGLGVALGKPAYVVKKDCKRGTVVLGGEADLYTDTLFANDVNWISIPGLQAPIRVTAKSRYRQNDQPAWVEPLENGYVKVRFDQPQRAVTAGQAVVFYDGDVVVGGGTICDT